MRVERERGSVTSFVAIITAALVFVAGLVVDGGQMLNARREAANAAESAARAGAQEIDTTLLRSGGPARLEPLEARRRAEQFLADTGYSGSAAADTESISVSVSIEEPMSILSIGGLGTVTVTGVGTATPLQGINEASP